MARFVGKCKRCRRVHRVEGELVVEPRHKKTAEVDGMRAERWKGRWVLSVDCCARDPRRDLTPGPYTVQLEKVFAAAATTHECGARCRSSTGPACECSCRGKNHGSG